MRGNKILKYLDYYLGTVIVLLLAPFRRKTAPAPARLEKILVIKLAAVGDTVLLVPSLRALRKRFPRAEITMVGTTINRELVQLFPDYVDRFRELQVQRAVSNPLYFFDFMRVLRSERFDAVIDFEQWSFLTPIVCHLAGIPHTFGFRIHKPVRHLLYSKTYERQRNKHESENFVGLLTLLGVQAPPPRLELPVNKSVRAEVKTALVDKGWKPSQRLVVLHPGCGVHGFPREWPLSSYKSLCGRLLDEFNVFVVVTGSAGEERLKRELVRSFPSQGCSWDDSSLEKLIALLSMARLFISGNNGVMHLAAALRIPQIALHGPTDSAKWGPLSPNAVVLRSRCPECPCLDLGFEYHRTDGYCMRQIDVDEVYTAARGILRGKKSKK